MRETDVVIVGAGPIGLEVAAALKQAGASHIQLEAGQVANTITGWPRMTRFLSCPQGLSIAGVPTTSVGQDRLLGEDYLAYLRGVVRQFDLSINTFERVIALEKQAGGFHLRTRKPFGQCEYRCRRVVLATGDMADHRRLGAAGEDLPHVRHGYDDPHEFFRRRVLVVGGRNSALEAVLRLWRMGTDVALSYRGDAIDPARTSHKLTPLVADLIHEGKIRFLPRTIPVEITPDAAVLAPTDDDGRATDGPRSDQPADVVLILIGFVSDPALFELAGVAFDGDGGGPVFDPDTMETNVPGLYVAGTAAATREAGHSLFIDTCHEHVPRIVAAIMGDSAAESRGS